MRALLAAATVGFGLAVASPAQAQTSQQTLPKTDTPQSESTGPQDPRSTGSTARSNETLSERLSETGGVIRPPQNTTPDMAIRPADPGTTRVIPPPGSPGGNPAMQPQ